MMYLMLLVTMHLLELKPLKPLTKCYKKSPMQHKVEQEFKCNLQSRKDLTSDQCQHQSKKGYKLQKITNSNKERLQTTKNYQLKHIMTSQVSKCLSQPF